MSSEIQPHFTEDEIVALNMRFEVELLDKGIKFLLSEMSFFKDLLTSKIFRNNVSNTEDVTLLMEALESFHVKTELHLGTVLNFSLKLKNIRECDDVYCEVHYIKEYQQLRRVLQDHIADAQHLKEYIHRYVFTLLR